MNGSVRNCLLEKQDQRCALRSVTAMMHICIKVGLVCSVGSKVPQGSRFSSAEQEGAYAGPVQSLIQLSGRKQRGYTVGEKLFPGFSTWVEKCVTCQLVQ